MLVSSDTIITNHTKYMNNQSRYNHTTTIKKLQKATLPRVTHLHHLPIQQYSRNIVPHPIYPYSSAINNDTHSSLSTLIPEGYTIIIPNPNTTYQPLPNKINVNIMRNNLPHIDLITIISISTHHSS